jgi:transcriptional regulator with GAF, ATPase, and Fis domain
VSVEYNPHLLEIVAALKEITARITAASSLSTAVDDLLKVTVGLMPPYVRCCITVIAQGEPAAFAGAGLPAEVLDEAAHADGEGPCLEAVRSRDIVLSPRLADEARWPAWVGLARPHGIDAVLSYPFDIDPSNLGALSLYADRPEAFDGELPIITMLIADHASLLLRARLRQLVHEDMVAEVVDLPVGDATLERAIGIVMAQRGCPPEQALRHLHEAATQLGVGLPAVAERLVRTVGDRGGPA